VCGDSPCRGPFYVVSSTIDPTGTDWNALSSGGSFEGRSRYALRAIDCHLSYASSLVGLCGIAAAIAALMRKCRWATIHGKNAILRMP
jgi:hypothetical protein